MIATVQINWPEYKKDLLCDLQNQRLWAMGTPPMSENPHESNIQMIEKELSLIENDRLDEVIAMHNDEEYWEDFLNDAVICPYCTSDDVRIIDRNDDTWDPIYQCNFCDTKFTKP